jgi:hypothetical protein
MGSKENKSLTLPESIEILVERTHEDNLLKFAEEDAKDVFSWYTSWQLSKDPLMKDYYLRRMKECIRKNGGVMSYLKGIHSAYNMGKADLNRELADEMIRKYPVSGRFFKLASYFSPNGFFL